MEYNTRIVQINLLKMLKSFHVFCLSNSLRYYIVGGTLLGSVRHGGFIPWDDDIDIAMPREDYQKLEKMDIGLTFKELEFKYYKNTKRCPIHYMKLVNKNTTLIENTYRNYVEGLYIDIFPLDGVSLEPKVERRRRNKIDRLHMIIMNNCRTEKRKSAFGEMKRCISKLANLTQIHNTLEKELLRYSYEDSEIVTNYLGAYGSKENVQRTVFGKPVLYTFEDAEFYGPERGKEYLKHIYGDYMQLPPVEKRVNKHDYFYINLNTPYAEYRLE